MRTTLTRKNEKKPAPWTGGTTTQLAIYPPGSGLKECNFIFRISTARVDAETSTFTHLPGVTRVIMILEGEMELTHRGQYSKILKPSETDTFPGDWETQSSGKVTDFNLMTTGKATGTLEWMEVARGMPVTISSLEEGSFSGIYVVNGQLILSAGGNSEMLKQGDFLLVSGESAGDQFMIEAEEESEFVLAEVLLNP